MRKHVYLLLIFWLSLQATAETAQPAPAKALFSDFTVEKMTFEIGREGCFDNGKSSRTYVRDGEVFIAQEPVGYSYFGYLDLSTPRIKASSVEEIITLIDQSSTQPISLDDFHFNEKDIKKFKQFIDYTEAKGCVSCVNTETFLYQFSTPINFAFYKQSVDSLTDLSPEEINTIFWQASTDTASFREWRIVEFSFSNGQTLSLKNEELVPNYLYTPWKAKFSELDFYVNSIILGQKIDAMTHGQFFDADVKDKKLALFNIADYLYRKKLEKDHQAFFDAQQASTPTESGQ